LLWTFSLLITFSLSLPVILYLLEQDQRQLHQLHGAGVSRISFFFSPAPLRCRLVFKNKKLYSRDFVNCLDASRRTLSSVCYLNCFSFSYEVLCMIVIFPLASRTEPARRVLLSTTTFRTYFPPPHVKPQSRKELVQSLLGRLTMASPSHHPRAYKLTPIMSC